LDMGPSNKKPARERPVAVFSDIFKVAASDRPNRHWAVI
jgi:hypothetical protein